MRTPELTHGCAGRLRRALLRITQPARLALANFRSPHTASTTDHQDPDHPTWRKPGWRVWWPLQGKDSRE